MPFNVGYASVLSAAVYNGFINLTNPFAVLSGEFYRLVAFPVKSWSSNIFVLKLKSLKFSNNNQLGTFETWNNTHVTI